MTYKDVVDRIHDVVTRHKMLADFGYGQLSDIKVHAEGGEADYPYLFLNPDTHTREGVSMVYNFNMIVMDIAGDEDNNHSNWMAIQSKCQQYIDDVVAELHYGYQDKPIIDYQNLTYTPFKSRFQDDVAGMTAQLKIQVPTPIDLCVAPVAPRELLLGNLFTNPDVNGTDDFHQAFRAGARDEINYPQYDYQWNEFEPWYRSNETPYSYAQGRSPLVINDDPDIGGEGLVPYFNGGSRQVQVPTEWSGTLRLEYDLELTNVQGLDLSDDRFWWQVVINGQEQFYVDVPNLPTDGTPVPFKESFDYVAEAGRQDDIRILFRYNDQGTPAPDGPVVGFRGSFKLKEIL